MRFLQDSTQKQNATTQGRILRTSGRPQPEPDLNVYALADISSVTEKAINTLLKKYQKKPKCQLEQQSQ